MPKGKERPNATCHPSRPHYAHGLCRACDHKRRYDEKYKFNAEYKNKVKAWVKKNPDKRRAIVNRWKSKNLDKVRAKSKRWYWKHLDIARRLIRESYQKHRTQRLEYSKKYSKSHPGQNRASAAKRRAQKHGGHSTSNPVQREWRAMLFGYQCAYCGGKYEHIDHLIALARGGDDSPGNLVPACERCNQSKKVSNWKEWYRKQEFYSYKREKFIEDNCS